MRATSLLRVWVLAIALAIVSALARAETTGVASSPAVIDFRAQFKDSLTDLPDPGELSAKGTVYVPTYSRVYGASSGEHKLIAFSTTLRIDNTSATKPLVIERIEYYDTAGKLVQSYLTEPVALRPFGSIELVVPAEDVRGGAAANFIVAWAGAGPMAEPLVEAVMIGSEDNTSYSFVSPGRPIRHIGHSVWPQFRFKF
ncbi:MAG TPA: DUF3124 domain-containing protein [Xanthobacteraceae bacterium]|jgi:Protein of unknown function (DUF3124)